MIGFRSCTLLQGDGDDVVPDVLLHLQATEDLGIGEVDVPGLEALEQASRCVSEASRFLPCYSRPFRLQIVHVKS